MRKRDFISSDAYASIMIRKGFSFLSFLFCVILRVPGIQRSLWVMIARFRKRGVSFHCVLRDIASNRDTAFPRVTSASIARFRVFI